MGVGLYLTGSYEDDEGGRAAEDWLEDAAAWLEGHEEEPLMLCHTGVNDADHPTLFVQIHPCAEDVEISVPAVGVCVVTAKTSTAGPGYHIFLCDLLHSFGDEFSIEWDPPSEIEEDDTGDETGYFYERNADAVRQEMLRWLSAVAGIVAENARERDGSSVQMVSMPLNHGYHEQQGILTPVGPRSTQWFERLVDDPASGIDFFPWWNEGVGADFFLGRAVCLMWQEVCWRLPIEEDEGELLMDIHLDLERAHYIDPQCKMPWREWAEILGYLTEHFGYAEFQHEEGLEDLIQRQAALVDPNTPLIGYRRGAVSVTLTGGWTLTIPGEFAEEWEESGETWSAWHGGRTIWFTSWSACGPDDQVLSAQEILDSRPWPDDAEVIEYQDGPLLGRAVFMPCEEGGETLWNLKGYTAIEGNFALCNIYLQSEEDRDWAIQLWKSMRN